MITHFSLLQGIAPSHLNAVFSRQTADHLLQLNGGNVCILCVQQPVLVPTHHPVQFNKLRPVDLLLSNDLNVSPQQAFLFSELILDPTFSIIEREYDTQEHQNRSAHHTQEG